MEIEFNEIKERTKNIEKPGILNYKKELILRTDASNIRLRVLLLQKVEQAK